MSERLGEKLERSLPPAPGPGATVARATRPACLVVDEKCGSACEFQRSNGAVVVLPYHHLSRVELTADGAGLTVAFSETEVRLAGAQLGAIKDALARGCNVCVRAADPRWKSAFRDDEVFVATLEITERKRGATESPGPLEGGAP
jgi:hypothetical protein